MPKFRVRIIETQEVLKDCVVQWDNDPPPGHSPNSYASQLATDGQHAHEHYVTHRGITKRQVVGFPVRIPSNARDAP